MKDDDLKLPDFCDIPAEPKRLSMDEYYEFVMFNLSNAVDIERHRREKRQERYPVPFKLD